MTRVKCRGGGKLITMQWKGEENTKREGKKMHIMRKIMVKRHETKEINVYRKRGKSG